MRVHLGGVGKGYAVDRAVAILRSRGLTDFMVQSGGDLYVGGHKGNLPWRLGLRDPRGPADKIFATLELSDATFSTSGDYERFFMQRRRPLPPPARSGLGQPARGARSVTIVAQTSVVADVLSTGVFVLGPGGRNGAHRAAARRRRRDRHVQERGADLVRPPVEVAAVWRQPTDAP